MLLLKVELRKVWKRPFFLIVIAFLCFVNLFMLWTTTRTDIDANGSAYLKLDKDLKELSMGDRGKFIESYSKSIDALFRIDSMKKAKIAFLEEYQTTGAMEDYEDLFRNANDEYSEEDLALYETHSYTLYTNSLQAEAELINAVKQEIQQSSGYSQFLSDLQEKAEKLKRVSLFSDESSYEQKVTQNSAKIYATMKNVIIDYSTQKGLMNALTFVYTDIILVFSMLVLASILIRDEKDNNMLSLIRSTPRGQAKTCLAKVGAMGLSLFIIIVFLYLVNLVYCSMIYGLGDLSRSIQSVPFLMKSVLKINVLQYLLVFLGTKWVGAFVCGLWILLASLLTKHAFSGYLVGVFFLAAQLVIKTIIPATSRLNIFKYANIVSLLNTSELLGDYFALYWLGTPVSRFIVECVSTMVFFVILLAILVIAFSKMQLISQHSIYIKLPKLFRYRKDRSSGIAWQECFKLLFTNGSAIIFAMFLGFQLWQCTQVKVYIGAEEAYYKFYMTNLDGAYTQEKHNWLLNSAKKLSDSSEEISSNVAATQTETKVFRQVLAKVRQTQSVPNAQLVYDSGYKVMFGLEGNEDLIEMLICGFVSALCFSGFYSIEKESGMHHLIKTTPLGRYFTTKGKIRISMFLAIFMGVISLVPRWYGAIKYFGLNSLLAPAFSMEFYSHLPKSINIFSMMVCVLLTRVAACIIMSLVALYVSEKSGNTIVAILVSTGMLCLPSILSLGGLPGVQWLGVYPLFHFAALLATPFNSLLAVPSILCAYALYKYFIQKLTYAYII